MSHRGEHPHYFSDKTFYLDSSYLCIFVLAIKTYYMKSASKHQCSRINLVLVLFVLLLLNACSKDPVAIDFEKYEGYWKPVSLSDWTGMHNAPPFFDRPGTTHYIKGDKLYRDVVTLLNDSNGNPYTTKRVDSFKLEYLVQSKLKEQGSSILVVTEQYDGLTSTGNLGVRLTYKREIDLKNMSNPPFSNNTFEISEDNIRIHSYEWGGPYATILDRKLVRLR